MDWWTKFKTWLFGPEERFLCCPRCFVRFNDYFVTRYYPNPKESMYGVQVRYCYLCSRTAVLGTPKNYAPDPRLAKYLITELDGVLLTQKEMERKQLYAESRLLAPYPEKKGKNVSSNPATTAV